MSGADIDHHEDRAAISSRNAGPAAVAGVRSSRGSPISPQSIPFRR